jgi:hypothetical protein
VQAIGAFIYRKSYAAIGGAALALLGSQQVTQDVDLVVSQGETASIKMTFENR